MNDTLYLHCFDDDSDPKAEHLKRNLEAEHHLLYYYARKATFAGVHNAILAHRMVVKRRSMR